MPKQAETRAKIDAKLDLLEQSLKEQKHLSDPAFVLELIDSISIFWSVLSEEDREYVQFANHAIEEQFEWNVK
mgnify:CR=1 FL=1